MIAQITPRIVRLKKVAHMMRRSFIERETHMALPVAFLILNGKSPEGVTCSVVEWI